MERTNAIRYEIKALENALNNFDLKDLEMIEDILQDKIESKRESEKENEYNEAVKNIISNLKKIEDLEKDWQTAFTIERNDYHGVYADVSIDWDDLKYYLEESLNK